MKISELVAQRQGQISSAAISDVTVLLDLSQKSGIFRKPGNLFLSRRGFAWYFFCVGGFMRFAWIGALSVVLLTGCAITRHSATNPCSREGSLARGQKDAAMGRSQETVFLKTCSQELRPSAQAAYREGFEAARAKRALSGKDEEMLTEIDGIPVLDSSRAPASPSWVCEVEANSKVFTGVGVSREEATGSAKASCGSHMQASYCEKADCKQNM